MSDVFRLFAVLAIGLSSVAFGQCKHDEVTRYVTASVRLYESLDYERALDQLLRARPFSCGSDDDAVISMYEGAIRWDLGQQDQARSAFKEALLLEPDVDLPLKVSPKLRALIETTRADVKKELAPMLAKQAEEKRQRAAALSSANPVDPALSLTSPGLAPTRHFPALPVALTAVAVVGAAGFTAFGLMGRGNLAALENAPCAATKTCSVSAVNDVHTQFVVADVALWVGVASAVAALVTWVVWGVSP